MQCGDNEYYLHHNFDREEDKYGSLFVKDIADVNTPSTNFIIYGHNMKDGSMFGDLDKYREKTFYEDYSEIFYSVTIWNQFGTSGYIAIPSFDLYTAKQLKYFVLS